MSADDTDTVVTLPDRCEAHVSFPSGTKFRLLTPREEDRLHEREFLLPSDLAFGPYQETYEAGRAEGVSFERERVLKLLRECGLDNSTEATLCCFERSDQNLAKHKNVFDLRSLPRCGRIELLQLH